MRLTKSDLVKALAADERNAKLSQTQLTETINSLIDALQEALQTPGNEVMLIGLGRFKAVEIPAGPRRNPRTGDTVMVPAKRTIRFKPSKAS